MGYARFWHEKTLRAQTIWGAYSRPYMTSNYAEPSQYNRYANENLASAPAGPFARETQHLRLYKSSVHFRPRTWSASSIGENTDENTVGAEIGVAPTNLFDLITGSRGVWAQSVRGNWRYSQNTAKLSFFPPFPCLQEGALGFLQQQVRCSGVDADAAKPYRFGRNMNTPYMTTVHGEKTEMNSRLPLKLLKPSPRCQNSNQQAKLEAVTRTPPEPRNRPSPNILVWHGRWVWRFQCSVEQFSSVPFDRRTGLPKSLNDFE
jgi:hypothetical protein